MTSLGDFLRSRIGSTSPWNCSTMPADWCIQLGYPDFAAAWRDTLDVALCDAVVSGAGGLLVLWDQGIGDGLRVTDDPDAGDIAVLAIGEREVGGVFTGERWATQAGRRLHFLAPEQVRVVKAWQP